MDTASPEQKKGSKKGLSIILAVIIILLGFGVYAGFFANDDGVDIEEGDIVSGLDSMTGVPTSGDWTFKLDIGNPGPATVVSSPTGAYVSVYADGQSLFFFNQSSIVPYTYKTSQRKFDLRTSNDEIINGYAYFEFTAVDDDYISGTLTHDTYPAGTATRSFEMQLESEVLPDTWPWYDLESGDWDVEFGGAESDCEDGPVTFPFPGTMEIDSSLSISDDGDSASGSVSMDIGGEEIILTPGAEAGELHGGTTGYTPGTPTDSAGNLLLDYDGDTYNVDVDAFAMDGEYIEGEMTLTGSGGCSFTVGFSGTSS